LKFFFFFEGGLSLRGLFKSLFHDFVGRACLLAVYLSIR